MRGALFLIIALAAGPLWAQTNESLEFSGPSNAPIYVIDGDFHYNITTNGVSLALDWSGSMDSASGNFSGSGDFSASGNISGIPIDWDGTVSAAMNLKTAGTVLRVNGKLTVAGAGTIAGYPLDRLLMVFSFTNLDVDVSTGQMSGYVSLKGSVKASGKTSSISLPKTYLSLDLPDTNNDGNWDSSGEWTEDITANVDAKGKVSGTAEFSVLDEDGEPYDTISQKISGTVKKGTVSLAAVGNQRATSKVKVNLTYLQSNDQAVTGKSSVSAYGQSRKF